MAKSKYNPFWEDRLETLKTAVDDAVLHGKISHISCLGIEQYGERDSWHGTVVVGNGKIIKGGEMAHIKALGDLIAPHTQIYPGQQIRFSMNKKQVLTVKLEGTTVKPPPKSKEDFKAGSVEFPKDCQKLHEFARSLKRYHHPLEPGLPKNGVYFCFEKGENAHGGEMIVRVGINREEGNLPARINHHYSGNIEGSVFREHVGNALENLEKVKISEEEISRYIRRTISFAVVQEDSKDERISLEKQALETLSTCRECGPSDHWLGNHSPNRTIRASGLWNVRDVKPQAVNLKLTPAQSTLILIPCSKQKTPENKSSYTPGERASIFGYLSPKSIEQLMKGREWVRPIAKIVENSSPNTALDLYVGYLYRVPGFREAVRSILCSGSCHVGIISGGYGIVLPNEKIQTYDCSLNTSYKRWLQAKLPFVISDFAAQLGVKQVIGFFARKSVYCRLFREVEWAYSGAELVRCYYPRTDAVLGLMDKVPRFLGAAAKLFIENKCDLDSLEDFSAEGMEIGWEDMCKHGD